MLDEGELQALWSFAHRVGRGIGVTREMAEDVAQEALLRLTALPPGSVQNLRAWLRVVVRNEVMLRRRQVLANAGDEALAATTVQPWHDTEARIEAEQILASLPARERRALTLAAEGYSQMEIAARMTCSVKMVEKLLRRARARGRGLSGR